MARRRPGPPPPTGAAARPARDPDPGADRCRSARSPTPTPFVTADGSTIRSLLDRTTAPVSHQSLAEATLAAGTATTRHYHRAAEEIYFLLEGSGTMDIDGDTGTRRRR